MPAGILRLHRSGVRVLRRRVLRQRTGQLCQPALLRLHRSGKLLHGAGRLTKPGGLCVNGSSELVERGPRLIDG